MNWSSERFLRKTYEGSAYEILGRHTNDLEFRKIFSGRRTKEVEDIRMNWGSEKFLRKTYE